MNNANSWTSTIIARADAKNKIIDLRDGLRVSDKHEYAMMHSLGGKHGIKSTVKVTICDYTKESSSITVSANMGIDTVYTLCGVAKDRQIRRSNAESDTTKLTAALIQLRGLYKLAANDTLKERLSTIAGHITDVLGTSPGRPDYTYSQERVDVYHKDSAGNVPVSMLTINHTSIRKDGAVSRMPWYIKITNGVAPAINNPNGTTSYNGAKLQIDKEAYINLSDADMARVMTRCVRYVETWENAVCIPVIRNGLIALQKERIAASENRT